MRWLPRCWGLRPGMGARHRQGAIGCFPHSPLVSNTLTTSGFQFRRIFSRPQRAPADSMLVIAAFRGVLINLLPRS